MSVSNKALDALMQPATKLAPDRRNRPVKEFVVGRDSWTHFTGMDLSANKKKKEIERERQNQNQRKQKYSAVEDGHDK